MLYSQTLNLDQVAFAADEIKHAQKTVCAKYLFFLNFRQGKK